VADPELTSGFAAGRRVSRERAPLCVIALIDLHRTAGDSEKLLLSMRIPCSGTFELCEQRVATATRSRRGSAGWYRPDSARERARALVITWFACIGWLSSPMEGSAPTGSRSIMARLESRGSCRVAVGAPCIEPTEFLRSYGRLQLALRMQLATGYPEQITVFDDLGIYQLLSESRTLRRPRN
jgi:hypothetical protein